MSIGLYPISMLGKEQLGHSAEHFLVCFKDIEQIKFGKND